MNSELDGVFETTVIPEHRGSVQLSPAQSDFVEDKINAGLKKLRESGTETQKLLLRENPDFMEKELRLEATGSTVAGYASLKGSENIVRKMTEEEARLAQQRKETSGEEAGKRSIYDAGKEGGHGGYYGGGVDHGWDAFRLTSPQTPPKTAETTKHPKK